MGANDKLAATFHPGYLIRFSIEDQQWVATCTEFTSLSWIAATPVKALKGLRRLIKQQA